MREITLSRGYVAIIDDDEFDKVSNVNWHACVTGRKLKLVYAMRIFGPMNNRQCVYLHRLIMSPPAGALVDHINKNTLDCRKANMRIATRSQNSANNRQELGVSGYRGVASANKKWACFVAHKYYGRYDTPEQAAYKYDEIAFSIWGKFATLNFPEGGPRASAA